MRDTERMNLRELMETYRPREDLFSMEGARTRLLKEVIFSDLTEIERRIILLYAELGSQRRLGRLMGLSAATINKIIREIKEKIYGCMDKRVADNPYMRYGG